MYGTRLPNTYFYETVDEGYGIPIIRIYAPRRIIRNK